MRTLIVLPDGSEIYSGQSLTNAVQNCTITYSVNAQEDLVMGSVCPTMVELELLTPNGVLKLSSGEEIEVYKVDANDIRVKVGTFVVEEPVKTGSDTRRVVAYDRLCLLNKDLSEWLASLLQWPYNLYDFASLVCAQCGLQLHNLSLPNGDFPVQRFLYSNVTGRQLMQWIGEAVGMFCKATVDGSVEFTTYSSTNIVIGPSSKDYEVFYYQGALQLKDYKVQQIDRVQIRQGDTDIGTVYPEDVEATNTFVVQDNPLLVAVNANTLVPIASTLYETLKDITYTPCTVTVPEYSGVQVGDVVQLVDANAQEYTVYVMSITNKGHRDEIKCTGAINRSSLKSINGKQYQRLAGKILNLSATVEGLRVENKETQLRVENLGNALAGVQSGGRNLLQNTKSMSSYTLSETASVDTSLGEFAVATLPAVADNNFSTLTALPFVELSTVARKQIVLSFEVRQTTLLDVDSSIADLVVRLGATTDESVDMVSYRDLEIRPSTVGNAWSSVSATAYITEEFFSDDVEISESLTSLIVQLRNCTSLDVQIRKLKLELGSEATAWSPAFEDLATSEDLNNSVLTIQEAMTELKLDTEGLSAKVSKNTTVVDDLNNQVAQLSSTVSTKVDSSSVQIQIDTAMQNGVAKVDTGTGFRFDAEGLTVDATDSATKTTITDDGMTVYEKSGISEVAVLEASSAGVDARNLHATTYLIVGKNSRFEDYGNGRTGCFWIGGN